MNGHETSNDHLYIKSSTRYDDSHTGKILREWCEVWTIISNKTINKGRLNKRNNGFRIQKCFKTSLDQDQRCCLGVITSVWNNMSRSLVATTFIIFFEIYATTPHSTGNEFSINCGLNLNFTEKDACFV